MVKFNADNRILSVENVPLSFLSFFLSLCFWSRHENQQPARSIVVSLKCSNCNSDKDKRANAEERAAGGGRRRSVRLFVRSFVRVLLPCHRAHKVYVKRAKERRIEGARARKKDDDGFSGRDSPLNEE